jgi:diguanylate cyclase (GGDEF)-like protein
MRKGETDESPGAGSNDVESLTGVAKIDQPGKRSDVDHEATLLSREKLVTVREDAADIRENASDLREDAVLAREGATQAREGESNVREVAATLREAEIRAVEDTILTSSSDQIDMLQQANAHLVIATMDANRLTEQVETAKGKLDHLAHHDGLTDLPNRVLLQDRLGQAIELARRQGRHLAVLFMDLDRFKHINDSLGHGVGDQLLKSVAQRLVACVRQSDTVCRQGGDEFVLLLAVIEHAVDAAQFAQKILTALALPYSIDGHDLYVSASIGIGVYPADGKDVETLLKCADTAMYHAKENGRNNYQFFKPEMNARAVERQAIEVSLRHALERQEFVLHYQPKIALNSGAIVGVEALIRWQHPQLGLLMPQEFVPIAEDSGLILPIGRWVLRSACLQAQVWLLAGLPPVTMAVNTSALEFRAGDFLENLRTILHETQLAPHYLEIELTESVLIRDVDAAESVLHAIAKLGVKLAIDDFGTGYSNLSYLKKFPIDTLKIDKSFVHEMTTSSDDASIVKAVISMGKSLKQRIIAEGVETAEQHASLLALHCDEGQGFFFSRPVAAEAIATLLQASPAGSPTDWASKYVEVGSAKSGSQS